MEKYVRLCRTVNTKGDLVSLGDIKDTSKLESILNKDSNADWYTSLYYYGREGKEYFDKSGSIKGYVGTALSNKLVFDFDCKDDVSQAKVDTLSLLNILSKEGINVKNSAIIYFSGGKGFHVEIPLSTELCPDDLKEICKNIAINLKTFDTSIYNTTRLYRLANTKHQVTGLYKVPFTPTEFFKLSIQDIKDTAKTPRKISYKPAAVQDTSFLKKFTKPIKTPTPTITTTSTEGIRGLNTLDFTKCPKQVPRCIYALQQGIMRPGERSRIFYRLANYFKNQGMNKEATFGALKGIARENQKLYPEATLIDKTEIWNQHVESAYNTKSSKQAPGSPGTRADNELIKPYCEAIKSSIPCALHAPYDSASTVIQIDSVFDSFSRFAENYDKNRVLTGLGFIDENMHISVGTSTLLVGACGSGKTTVALNIMERANELGQHTMFFSLDMHKNLVMLKLATKLTNYTRDEIISFYQNKNEPKKQEIRDIIKQKYGKTYFDFTGTLTMDQMKDKVLAAQEKAGADIRLVIVDYASRIRSDNKDRYANSTYNALRSKEVAADTEAAWIFISQISRNTGDGSNPLRTKRAAKESGDWEESASNVITIWRPFMGQEGRDDVMRMFLAKNRMGKELERPLWWSGEKGLIWDMSSTEYTDYKELREPEENEVLKRKMIGGVKKIG